MQHRSLKLQKWGNSQGIRLPLHLVEQFGVKPGESIEYRVQKDGVILKFSPLSRRHTRQYRLEHLLAKIPRKHKNKEIKWGHSRGKEAW